MSGGDAPSGGERAGARNDGQSMLSVATGLTSSAAAALGPLVAGGARGRGRGRGSSSASAKATNAPPASNAPPETNAPPSSVEEPVVSVEDSQTRVSSATAMTSSAAAALGPLLGVRGKRGRGTGTEEQRRIPSRVSFTETNAADLPSAKAAYRWTTLGSVDYAQHPDWLPGVVAAKAKVTPAQMSALERNGRFQDAVDAKYIEEEADNNKAYRWTFLGTVDYAPQPDWLPGDVTPKAEVTPEQVSALERNGKLQEAVDDKYIEEVTAVCPKGHPLIALGTSEDNGWACDGRQQPGGCKSGITDFHQTRGMKKFTCRQCKYDLCLKCYAAQDDAPRTSPKMTAAIKNVMAASALSRRPAAKASSASSSDSPLIDPNPSNSIEVNPNRGFDASSRASSSRVPAVAPKNPGPPKESAKAAAQRANAGAKIVALADAAARNARATAESAEAALGNRDMLGDYASVPAPAAEQAAASAIARPPPVTPHLPPPPLGGMLPLLPLPVQSVEPSVAEMSPASGQRTDSARLRAHALAVSAGTADAVARAERVLATPTRLGEQVRVGGSTGIRPGGAPRAVSREQQDLGTDDVVAAAALVAEAARRTAESTADSVGMLRQAPVEDNQEDETQVQRATADVVAAAADVAAAAAAAATTSEEMCRYAEISLRSPSLLGEYAYSEGGTPPAPRMPILPPPPASTIGNEVSTASAAGGRASESGLAPEDRQETILPISEDTGERLGRHSAIPQDDEDEQWEDEDGDGPAAPLLGVQRREQSRSKSRGTEYDEEERAPTTRTSISASFDKESEESGSSGWSGSNGDSEFCCSLILRACGVLLGTVLLSGAMVVFFSVIYPAIKFSIIKEAPRPPPGVNPINSKRTRIVHLTVPKIASSGEKPWTFHPIPIWLVPQAIPGSVKTTFPPVPVTTSRAPVQSPPPTTPALAVPEGATTPVTTVTTRATPTTSSVAIPSKVSAECRHVVLSAWSSWSACPSCGGGKRSRQRAVPTADEACRSQFRLSEDLPCPAPVFLTVTDWAEWGACSASCGPGFYERIRQVRTGMEQCTLPAMKEHRFCKLGECSCPSSLSALMSDWLDWSACSATCAGGHAKRHRYRLQAFKNCNGVPKLVETHTCNNFPCAGMMHSNETLSVSWTLQNLDYGILKANPELINNFVFTVKDTIAREADFRPGDVSVRLRKSATSRGSVHVETLARPPTGTALPITVVPALRGSKTLANTIVSEVLSVDGIDAATTGNVVLIHLRIQGIEERPCGTSPWTEWSLCSPSCGPGHQYRTRRKFTDAVGHCYSVPLSDSQECFGASCPSDCAVGPWTPWTTCSSTCGIGQQVRTRRPLGSPLNFRPEACGDLRDLQTCDASVPCPTLCSGGIDSTVAHANMADLQKCAGSPSYRTCSISCSPGFLASGSVTCLDGKWQSSLECEEARCEQAPVIEHSVDLTVCAGAEPGETCTVDCLLGFAKSGDVVCHHGKWSKARCNAVRCSQTIPRIAHAVDSSNQCVEWAADVVPGTRGCPFFACKPGFQPSHPLRCVTGVWQVPECLEKPCLTAPTIIGGLFLSQCARRAAGSICDFHCAAGLRRTAAAVCANGNWTPALCVTATCFNLNGSCPESIQLSQAGLVNRRLAWPPRKNVTRRSRSVNRFYLSCAAAPQLRSPVKGGHSALATCAGMGIGGICELPVAACESGQVPAGRFICGAGGSWVGDSPICVPQRCRAIPVVNHSVALDACADSLSGTMCQVSCLAGFTPTSNAECKNGRWSGGLCTPLKCLQAPVILHGTVDQARCSSLKVGDECPLTCNDGYAKEGVLRCLGSMIRGARCVPARCSTPPRPAFAANLSACAGAPSGAVCSIQCLTGYNKTSDAICSRGKWSEVHCKPIDCGTPPGIINARAGVQTSCVGTPSAARCTSFSCQDGFSKSSELLCIHGVFNQPKCKPSSCAMRAGNSVADAEIENCVTHGSLLRCSIRCSGGRVRTGDVICLDGQWWMPRCLPAWESASLKTPEYSVVQVSFHSQRTVVVTDFIKAAARLASAVRALTRIAPDRVWVRPTLALVAGKQIGFTVEIGPPRASRDAGVARRKPISALAASHKLLTWTQHLALLLGVPLAGVFVKMLGRIAGKRCLAAPGIPHSLGLDACVPALPGSICTVKCMDGFQKTGDLACADGDWMGMSSVKCLPAPCTKPPTPILWAADLSKCRDYTSGSICPVQCQPGYRKTQDVMCSRGFWNTATCFPEPCDVPPTLYGSAPLEACAGMPHGYACKPLCRAGRAPSHSRGILCSYGNWQYSSAPSCNHTGCLSVPAVVHSRSLDHCAGTAPEDTCEFGCIAGFEPAGQLLCISGEWTRASCEPQKCVRAPSINGAPLDRCIGTASGAFCTIQCPMDQHKTGDLLCMRGQWVDEQNARCSSLQVAGPACSVAPIIANADTTQCAGTASGSSCSGNFCAPGYGFQGPLICVSGIWSPAQCVAERCVEVPIVPHARYLKLCAGMPKGGMCALHCEAGYSVSGMPSLSIGELSEPSNFLRAALTCGRDNKFVGPRCEPAACNSYPVVPFARNLGHCPGIRAGNVCDFSCAGGYERGINVVRCIGASWQVAPNRCREASCRSPALALRIPAAARCKGTASQSFCEYECPSTLTLATPLYCSRGSWMNEDAAICRRYCTKKPDPILYSISNLSTCAPTEARGYCPINCQLGYWASGALFCDPETLEWNTVACYPHEQIFHLQTHYSFQLSGLQVQGDAEIRQAIESLSRVLAAYLGISAYLMHMELVLHAPSLPPVERIGTYVVDTATLRSSDFKVKLFVACKTCTLVQRRLQLLGQHARELDTVLAQGICGDRCLPLPGVPSLGESLEKDACLQSCPEVRAPLKTLYHREPIIESRTAV